MHPFRKEELLTDFIIQECVTCPVVHARENDGRCLIVYRLDRREKNVCMGVLESNILRESLASMLVVCLRVVK